MSTNRLAVLAALAGLLASSACDTARPIADNGGGGSACTACHGGTDNNTGAPPVDASGNAASPAVGAHTSHVNAQVACTACHGTAPGGTGHNDGQPTEIAFTGTAVLDGATPTYDRGTQTCSGVYCHGATVADGSATAPIWTGGALGCTSCHGYPPLSVAPHTAATTNCSLCHTAVPGPNHVNGTVDRVQVHPANYATPTVHGPDAIADLATCQSCHGADFDGEVGPSCNACHADPLNGWSATALTTNCTFCHGTKTKPTFDFAAAPELAAPPEGVAGATAATDPSVGAHQAHLVGAVYSNGFACTECHAIPTDLAHIADGAAGAEHTWGSLAAQGTTPTFDPGALTCTNYCHGATINTTAPLSPAWTATGPACAACHASRPSTGLHTFAPHAAAPCTFCHIDYVQDTGVNLAFHVNGAKDVVFLRAGGTPGETYTLTTAWTDCNACHNNNANY
jgi:predicted CxxxxCH...CXXCH cytochrome family protein